MATPVLYHIEVSHYNEKARWALDYKRDTARAEGASSEARYQVPEPLPETSAERRGALASRSGFQWAQEMYRRHRGESAEVPA